MLKVAAVSWLHFYDIQDRLCTVVSEVTLEVGRQDVKNFDVFQMTKPYVHKQNSGPVKYHQCKEEKVTFKIDLNKPSQSMESLEVIALQLTDNTT